ncbi:Lysine histidine transporter-like 5 [Vigna angularis]|uniref:Lysine histidine transporter-like 5 n=1 Tax=Phaseolus angularis TaxID=3914 RepID=A0A8T0JG70_PHAAN|nr:Lysine histidine transporter-like 5 [Vigna angularis]
MEHANGNVEMRSARDPHKVENWMPDESDSRKAKWWYSSFHNVTAMVGAGVLGLPFAIAQLGWVPGVITIVVSWLLTFYTLWLLAEMHEMAPGLRFDRYYDLGVHVLGPKKGLWLVMPQQLTVQVASAIVYCVTGGKSLKKFFQILSVRGMSDIRQTYYILIFVVLQIMLSQTPNFHNLKAVSSLAAVMSICYSMVAFIMSVIEGLKGHPRSYDVRSHTTAGRTFDAFNALGTIAFAFAGHSVALEIQATLPSTVEKPSKIPMWRGVVVAYSIVIFCYATVAISGFWAFGNAVEDDVLITLEHPFWLIAIANFMVFLHVVGSFQVFSMPVFDTIETTLVEKLNCNRSVMLRAVSRTIFVCLVGFIGMCIPFFGGLLGFFGGLAFTFLVCYGLRQQNLEDGVSIGWYHGRRLSDTKALNLVVVSSSGHAFWSRWKPSVRFQVSFFGRVSKELQIIVSMIGPWGKRLSKLEASSDHVVEAQQKSGLQVLD